MKIVVAASAAWFALACASAKTADESTDVLGIAELPHIVEVGIAHHGDVGRFAGRTFSVEARFAHMDHHDDSATAHRQDNARAFEVIVTKEVALPKNVGNIYVSCLLPADHPYAALADSVPLGKDPKEFAGDFILTGAIESVDYQAAARDATLNLALGCSVRPRQ